MTCDTAILGAGVAGLVAAKTCLDQGERNVVVIDEYDRPGGNHIDVALNGYTFDIGSIVFHDNSPFFRHFPEALAACVPADCSVSKVTASGAIGAYPLSWRHDVLRHGPAGIAGLALSLARGRLAGGEVRTTRDYAARLIGERLLATSGLEAFIERFHGLPAEALEAAFGAKRMGWLERATSPRHLLRQAVAKLASRGAEPRAHVRPAAGFASLYTPIQEVLERRGVRFLLGAGLLSIGDGGQSKEVRSTMGRLRPQGLISTIPLARTLELAGLPARPELVERRLISLFFSFAGHRGFASPILYNFSHLGCWKRLAVFSDYYGRRRGREYLTVEVNAPSGTASAHEDLVEEAIADFTADMRLKRLLAGDLRLEGAHFLDHAYPSYPLGATQAIDTAIEWLRGRGITVAGRQGAHDYLPTAHGVTTAVEARLADRRRLPPAS